MRLLNASPVFVASSIAFDSTISSWPLPLPGSASLPISFSLIDFIDHTVTPNGLQPTAAEVMALSQNFMHFNLPQLRNLRGGISSYCRFLPDLSKRLQPLHFLPKETVPFAFTAEMEVIMKAIFTDPSTPSLLAFLDWIAAIDDFGKFRLYCNDSRDGLAAHLNRARLTTPSARSRSSVESSLTIGATGLFRILRLELSSCSSSSFVGISFRSSLSFTVNTRIAFGVVSIYYGLTSHR